MKLPHRLALGLAQASFLSLSQRWQEVGRRGKSKASVLAGP